MVLILRPLNGKIFITYKLLRTCYEIQKHLVFWFYI